MATLAPMPSPSIGLAATIRCVARHGRTGSLPLKAADVRLIRYVAPCSGSASLAVGAPAMIQSHDVETDSPTCSSG
jgi:hypothetical protein